MATTCKYYEACNFPEWDKCQNNAFTKKGKKCYAYRIKEQNKNGFDNK